MGLLDRFKKKKEMELQKGVAAPVASESKKTEKKAEKKVEKKQGKVVRAETTRVIIAPLVSEKAAQLSEQRTYVFRVDRSATKTQVAAAFKELYGLIPTRVNVVNLRAEPVRFGRAMGKEKAWKKAFVTIPEGKEIQVYEGV